MMIPICDAAYEHNLHYSQIWYPTDLISGFCSLVEHDAHMNVAPLPAYKNSNHHILMIFCPYPDAEIKQVLPICNNGTEEEHH